jgi:cellulose biosynthesis protein BcsQ
MKIISVVTQKGGVGKTACAFNLAKAAKDVLNLRTAVIDLDGQANLSIALTGGIEIKKQSEGGSDELFTSAWPKPTKTEHGIDLYHGHAQTSIGSTTTTTAKRKACRRKCACAFASCPTT